MRKYAAVESYFVLEQQIRRGKKTLLFRHPGRTWPKSAKGKLEIFQNHQQTVIDGFENVTVCPQARRLLND